MKSNITTRCKDSLNISSLEVIHFNSPCIIEFELMITNFCQFSFWQQDHCIRFKFLLSLEDNEIVFELLNLDVVIYIDSFFNMQIQTRFVNSGPYWTWN
ncbi:unnamed protein product (macronuclear) [Paramecium tetraurelia]|uniref:Uncharacterized protein n=1 Tax=Paramecium tetraurelia TaxID=5888 RepID=A0CKG3_PARTE|nr:uncharacterized protein GSPATT00000994001 [Paramecium tetraurelia]CAK71280.1 unnamed protein product [Paramecium tetraurelia]|eukprot:XP_001438677.1 hypothetical protein (macronuclear) [Paramecium tetraurelia strain d4-2]